MKVLLIASKDDFSSDLSKVTGIGRYARQTYESLRKYLDVEKFPAYDYSSIFSALFTTIRSSLSFRYRNFDIIHLLSPKPFFPLFKGNARLVSTVHDLFFLKYQESATRFSNLYLLSIKRSDAVIAVSSKVKKDLINVDHKKRIFVVNPFIDDRFFVQRRENVEKKDYLKIGFIGKIDSERKNVLRAIRAFKSLKENVILELWGSFDKESKIIQEIMREMKEDKRIRLMGPVKEEDLIKVYDSFDAFILPSKEEGFGYPIIEAQSRGVPVIVFKDADIPEEVCKYCLRIREDLNEVIDEIDKINKDKLTSFAKKFNVNAYIENLINKYNEILNN